LKRSVGDLGNKETPLGGCWFPEHYNVPSGKSYERQKTSGPLPINPIATVTRVPYRDAWRQCHNAISTPTGELNRRAARTQQTHAHGNDPTQRTRQDSAERRSRRTIGWGIALESVETQGTGPFQTVRGTRANLRGTAWMTAFTVFDTATLRKLRRNRLTNATDLGESNHPIPRRAAWWSKPQCG